MENNIIINKMKRLDIKDVFNEFLEKVKKSSFDFRPAFNPNSFEIKFYEWSDLNRTPLVFKDFTTFINFLEKSNIETSTEDRFRIYSKGKVGCLAACVPDTHYIVTAYSLYALENEFRNYINKQNTVTQTTTPIVSQTNALVPHYLQHIT